MTTTRVDGLVAAGTTTVGGESTVLQVWGLWHLVGVTVSAFLDGLDCGDFTVASDGSVLVPLAGANAFVTAASLYADGTATAAAWGESGTPVTLTTASVSHLFYVAIVVGQPYVSQGQRLRAATQDNIKGSTGAATGRRRRTHQFAALIQDGITARFGTVLAPAPYGNMISTVFKQADEITPILNLAPNGTPPVQFSGVYWDTLVDSYTFDGGLCWQVDRPWPFTICAINQFLKAEEPA
jgi:hypothetical protein